jgi:hypothetical protein
MKTKQLFELVNKSTGQKVSRIIFGKFVTEYEYGNACRFTAADLASIQNNYPLNDFSIQEVA